MKKLLILMALLAMWSMTSFGADEAKDDSDLNVKPLDGITIEAVENYPNIKNHEIGFALGFYPFNPYYYGFSFGADYVYYFDKIWAWEVLNAAYALTAQTNLTAQLAQLQGYVPKNIEFLSAVFSTNVLATFAHGKLLFLDKYIRYFRSSLIVGAGLVMTSQQSQATGNLGIRFDAFVTDSFSWKLEVRDMITISGIQNYVGINLGTGIAF